MKSKKPSKRGVDPRKIEKYLQGAAKRGELNPQHRREFDQLVDDAMPPARSKKK